MTLYAKISKDCEKIKYKELSILINATLFEIYDEGGDYRGYAWLKEESKRLIKPRAVMVFEAYFNDEEEEFVFIKKLFTLIEDPAESALIYTAQKLWWDEEDIFNRARKRLEFEVISHILLNAEIHNLCTISFQSNVVGYRADVACMVKLIESDWDIPAPTVVIEIDEDHHRYRNKDEEILREKTVKATGNYMMRVPVKRSSSLADLAIVGSQTVKRLISLFSELIIKYSPNLSTEHFLKVARENDIDQELLALYMPEKTEKDTPFFISHERIGAYLGYEPDKDGWMKGLINIINRNLAENEDYKIVTQNFSVHRNFKKIEKLDFARKSTSGQNLKKTENRGGHNKKVYMMTRTAFHTICICSGKPKAKHAQMKLAILCSEALEYAKRLRAELLIDRSSKENVEALNERIGAKDKTKEERSKIHKLSEELKECKRQRDEALEKVAVLEKQNESYKQSLKNEANKKHRKIANELAILDFAVLSTSELRDMCKDEGIKGISKAGKRELIELLLE